MISVPSDDAQMREKLSDGMKATITADDDDGRGCCCILASKLHTILSLGCRQIGEEERNEEGEEVSSLPRSLLQS